MFNANDEDHCKEAVEEELCLYDPSCRYCKRLSTRRYAVCYLHGGQQNVKCLTNATEGMCPGVCGALKDCKSCVMFGKGDCTWCSSLQKCVNDSSSKSLLWSVFRQFLNF